MFLLLKKCQMTILKIVFLVYLQCDDDSITFIDAPISWHKEKNNYIEDSLAGSIVEDEF